MTCPQLYILGGGREIEQKIVVMMPIIPHLLLHRPLVWEKGLTCPSAVNAFLGSFPRPSQEAQLKTHCALSALTGLQALAALRISREEQEVAMKVYVGIDWSEHKHDVCFTHESGEALLILQIQHTIAGFRELDQSRQSLGVEVRGAGFAHVWTSHDRRYSHCTHVSLDRGSRNAKLWTQQNGDLPRTIEGASRVDLVDAPLNGQFPRRRRHRLIEQARVAEPQEIRLGLPRNLQIVLLQHA